MGRLNEHQGTTQSRVGTQGYPFSGGAPYRRRDGVPTWPSEAGLAADGGGVFMGIAGIPAAATEVIITGASTVEGMDVSIFAEYVLDGEARKHVFGTVRTPNGMSADDIADALAVEMNGGDVVASANLGTLSLSLAAAGNYIYMDSFFDLPWVGRNISPPPV